MRTLARFIFLCATLGASAANAVELIADERRVQVFSTDGNSESRPDPAFSAFSVSGQNSTVSPATFDASGSGFGESDFDFFVQQSYFDVVFSAADGETMSLIGGGSASAGDFGFTEVRVRLFSGSEIDNDVLLYSESVISDGFKTVFGDFELQQTLQAGTYRLVAQTDVTPGGFGTFGDFNINVSFGIDPEFDQDGDGVPNIDDNCIQTANSGQFDTDADGFGNACDADFNNDCVANFVDLGILRTTFFTNDALTDLTGDGVVNFVDLGVLRLLFFAPPGPSGLVETCVPQ
jgi:hypothetical protein